MLSCCASKDTTSFMFKFAIVLASVPSGLATLKTSNTKFLLSSSAELTLDLFFQNFLMFFLKEKVDLVEGVRISTVIGVGSVSIQPPKLVSSSWSEEEEEDDSKSAKINNYCLFKW